MGQKPEEIEDIAIADKEHKYARYEDVDKEQLEKDIDAIKETMPPVNEEDFQHLLKLERWGKRFTYSGLALILILSIVELAFAGLSAYIFWPLAIIAALLISTGNVSRWANTTHPILHGGYDKVPNIPERYTKKYFAIGARRYIN